MRIMTKVGIVMVIGMALILPMMLNYEDEGQALSERGFTTIEKADAKKEFSKNAEVMRQKLLDSTNQISSLYKKPFPFTPSRELYRRQVMKNYHEIPESLEKFASLMAKEMRQAKSDFVHAEALFEKLSLCASAPDSEEIIAVKATCAENARVLAARYPDMLQKRFAIMFKKLDQKVRAIL